MHNQKSVLIMAGGTGGHVFPALSVADQLQARNVHVEWLGTAAGIEARLVPSAGIKLHFLSVQGIRGKSITSLIKAPFLILKSILESMSVIKQLKPNLVIGLGGYASGPGGLAARLMRLPLVIHEQNAVPGTTNKYLSKVATRVLTAFPNVFKQSEHIGNPIRSNISELEDPKERFNSKTTLDPIRILVLGGSLGARFINTQLPSVFERLHQQCPVEIWHQCGQKNIDDTVTNYQNNTHKVTVDGFLENVSEALTWADLVLCRAGALTVSELAAAGVGAILFPYPYAIDDHQTKNAEWLVSSGAAVVQQENAYDPDTFLVQLTQLVSNRGQLLDMACAARSLAMPHAAQRFADICLEVMDG